MAWRTTLGNEILSTVPATLDGVGKERVEEGVDRAALARAAAGPSFVRVCGPAWTGSTPGWDDVVSRTRVSAA